MSRLKVALADYLVMRRALGFSLQKTETTLRSFLTYMESHGHCWITNEVALRWATHPKETNPAWWMERLLIVRKFARYVTNFERRTEIPPHGLLPHSYSRPAPHIYTDDEILRLIDHTRQTLPVTDLRRWTYVTIFGLLAFTGMRVGEALALDQDHVNLTDGSLTVREAKSKTARLVPLHPTVVRALDKYARRRRRMLSRSESPAFFLNLHGRRLSYDMVFQTFIRFSREVGLRGPSDRFGPRLHDFRHTFAVNALIHAYKADLDVDGQVHALSVYLGHIGPSSTYWYFSAVPELMALAATRLDMKLRGGRA